MPAHILIVEGDAALSSRLRSALAQRGHSIEETPDGREVLNIARRRRPGVIVLAVELPGGQNGYLLVGKLKKDDELRGVPVVIVGNPEGFSAHAKLKNRADDYLPRPFSPRFLIAKVRAVLRRYNAPRELEEVLKAQDLRLDTAARKVAVGGKPVALTRKEFDLLTTLLRKAGRVLTQRYLLETVWGYDVADYNDPHTLETHVSSLRRKLGTRFARKIVNVPALGYRFDA